jgi:hypothetical protein
MGTNFFSTTERKKTLGVQVSSLLLCFQINASDFSDSEDSYSGALTPLSATTDLTDYFDDIVTPVVQLLPQKETIRILSLDGGGIRGLVELYFLREIERFTGQKTGELFDFFAGTSIGSIIATALSETDPETGRIKYSADDVLNIFLQKYDKLFQKKFKSFGGLFGERYKTTPFKNFIESQFGNRLFSDRSKPTIVIAENLETLEPKIFKSYDTREDFKTSDVLLSSTAAPTLFKPHRAEVYKDGRPTNSHYKLVDGGLVANNPALIALDEARRHFPLAHRFEVFSLGSGHYEQMGADRIHLDAGSNIFKWARRLPKIFLNAQVSLTDSLMADLMPNVSFFRWNPILLTNQSIKLDSHSHADIDVLLHSSAQMIAKNWDKFEEIVLRLNPESFSETE